MSPAVACGHLPRAPARSSARSLLFIIDKSFVMVHPNIHDNYCNHEKYDFRAG
jgi:hypothetical protein